MDYSAGAAGVAAASICKRKGSIELKADVDEFDLLNPTRKGTLHVGGFLPKLSPHDFRRTFAVFLVRNKLGNLMTLKLKIKGLN